MWGDSRGNKLLSTRWHCGGAEVLTKWCQRFSLHHTESHHTPFSTVNIQANTSVKGHCMRVHVLMELVLGPQLPATKVPTATYGELHPGSSRVPVCLHNLSTCAVDVPAKTVVGQIVPANQVPLVVHPTKTATETKYPAQKGWVLEALDLQGLKEWSESCCSNGSTCLHTVTWIWAKLLWPNTK